MTTFQNLTALLYFDKEAEIFFNALPKECKSNIAERSQLFHSYKDLHAYAIYLQQNIL